MEGEQQQDERADTRPERGGEQQVGGELPAPLVRWPATLPLKVRRRPLGKSRCSRGAARTSTVHASPNAATTSSGSRICVGAIAAPARASGTSAAASTRPSMQTETVPDFNDRRRPERRCTSQTLSA